MPKFELSISPDYLPQWGVWEGVREVVQNAIDEEVQNPDHKMSIDYRPESLRLTVTNRGARLPIQALLIGKTSKANDERTIGHFGEGLKLGAMALVRAGYHVSILNQDELWVAKLEVNEKLGAKVLSFVITKTQSRHDGVSVVVSGIRPKQFEEFQTRFLQLSPPADCFTADGKGQVLLEQKHRGKVYVKGVLVREYGNLLFGYNLLDIATNRDRTMVDPGELSRVIGQIFGHSIVDSETEQEAEKKMDALMKVLVEENAAEFVNLYGSCSGMAFVNSGQKFKFKDMFCRSFRKLHGGSEKVFPVQGEADAQKLRHYGMDGKVVPWHTFNIFNCNFGDIQARLKEMAETPKKVYDTAELTIEEQENLAWAESVIAPTLLDQQLSTVEVVDFSDGDLLGMWQNGKGKELPSTSPDETPRHLNRIRLARSLLKSRLKTLRVLLHEYCHWYGADGSKGHVEMIELTWQQVCANLLDNAKTDLKAA